MLRIHVDEPFLIRSSTSPSGGEKGRSGLLENSSTCDDSIQRNTRAAIHLDENNEGSERDLFLCRIGGNESSSPINSNLSNLTNSTMDQLRFLPKYVDTVCRLPVLNIILAKNILLVQLSHMLC
jgi:hypothetical protein